MSVEEGQHSKKIIVVVKAVFFHFEEISQVFARVPKKHLWTSLLCLLVFTESSAETFVERPHKCCCENTSVTNNVTLFGLLRPGLAERETAVHKSFNNYTSAFALWHVKVTFVQSRQDVVLVSQHQSSGILFLLRWKITLKDLLWRNCLRADFMERLSACWSASWMLLI